MADTPSSAPPESGPVKTKDRDRHGLVGYTLSGRYYIQEVIGVGGMGVVYRAHQSTIDREVAVKVLMPEMIEDETLIKRFELEARAASRLNHPNTITVYDFGREGNLLYIVMEYLKGDSVDGLLDRLGVVSPDRAIHILQQVCGSLAEAHSKGIVHRDIKPDNIFLQTIEKQRDFVKVLDFGVAKLKDPKVQDVTLTQAGIIFGTPKYMSPEQAKARKLDGRSDIYSLGIVAWEMLMGRVPFLADDPVSILIQHVHDPAPYFADVRPDLRIPEGLEGVIRKAVEKDPTQRFDNAEAFREALLAVGDGRPTMSDPVVASSGGRYPAMPHGRPPSPSPYPQGPPPPMGPPPLTPPPGYMPGRDGTQWGLDQLGMAEIDATRMGVSLEPPRRSYAGLIITVVLLGVLLLLGVAYLLYRMSSKSTAEAPVVPVAADAGTTPVPVLPDTGQAIAPDTGVSETVAAVTDTETPDAGPAVAPTAEADSGEAGDTETSEDATQVALVEDIGPPEPRRIRVRIVQERPTRGMRLDFGDREVTQDEDDANVYLVDPEEGDALEFRARASGHHSRTVTVDLGEADENDFIEVSVQLRERESTPTRPTCAPDPITGFVDPFCGQ